VLVPDRQAVAVGVGHPGGGPGGLRVTRHPFRVGIHAIYSVREMGYGKLPGSTGRQHTQHDDQQLDEHLDVHDWFSTPQKPSACHP
jgi:hypothetical protein